MNASIRQIYDLLTDGERVTISHASWRSAENLRISLAKIHREFVAAGISDDSLLMRWDASTSSATYWLGLPERRVAAQFQILSHEKLTPVSDPIRGESISNSLDSDQNQHGTSSGPGSSASAGKIDSSDAEIQIPGERDESKSRTTWVWPDAS